MTKGHVMALTDHAPRRGPRHKECAVAYVLRKLPTDDERQQLRDWLVDSDVDLTDVARIIKAELDYPITGDALARHRRALLGESGCSCVREGRA
jgi:hypothetical protein